MLGQRGKAIAFSVVVLALFFFLECKVDVSIASASSTLPASMVDRVHVSSFEGILQTEIGAGEGMGSTLMPTETEAWSVTDGIIVRPQGATVTGCTSLFYYTLDIGFEVSNDLPKATDAAVRVSVFDNKTGGLLEAQSMQLSLIPGKTVPVGANFTIESGDANPVFLAKVAFPTSEELPNASAASRQVSLFEFLLMKAGLLRL